jgi:hypothetical protein
MGKLYDFIHDTHREFIERQKIFFVASAAPAGRVNVSPKGLDTLRILDERTVAYLDLTGSGNETAAHLLQTPRLTMMFCALEGNPMILRLYGQGRVYLPETADYAALASRFPTLPGARQIIELRVEAVQTSCGFGIPVFHYEAERAALPEWAMAKGEQGLQTYRQQKNTKSIDGFPITVTAKPPAAQD